MARAYIPKSIRQHVFRDAQNRCGYCLAPKRLIGRLHIEHIHPVAKGGSDEEENLWIACAICNGHKAAKTKAIDPKTKHSVPLFNPRMQDWWEHFDWSESGTHIIGLTPIGRATVDALHLNSDLDGLTIATLNLRMGLLQKARRRLNSSILACASLCVDTDGRGLWKEHCPFTG